MFLLYLIYVSPVANSKHCLLFTKKSELKQSYLGFNLYSAYELYIRHFEVKGTLYLGQIHIFRSHNFFKLLVANFVIYKITGRLY